MSDVQIKGLDKAIQRVGALPEHADAAQHTVIKALGDRWLALLQDETPRGEGETSGDLAGNYQTEEAYSALAASYHIYNLTPYLRFVLKGRGPVTAVSAKALRFVINGQVFFRRSVGPAQPNDFASRVADRMRGEVAEAGREIANLIVRAR